MPESDTKSVITVQSDSSFGNADSIQHKNEYMELAVLFHQQAAEYRALCYQAYNLGKLMLDRDLSDKTIDKNRAVILDIDETVLDNSPYQAECILKGINYPEKWDEWCERESAEAIPGSLDFLIYTKMNGVTVYYITNRKQHLKQATINNLKALGYPNADDEHVIMRTSENNKEGRRKDVLEKHHISVLFGDNLSDFSDIFDSKTNSERKASVDELKDEFGKRFIVLPNSMYGDWEIFLYETDKNQSASSRQQQRIKALNGF